MPTDLQPSQRVREAWLLAVRNIPGTPDRRREPGTCRGGMVLRLLGTDAYVRWDPVYSLVDGDSRDSVVEWVAASQLALEVVHVLHYGLPLCGFSRDIPAQWPDGHVWTHLRGHDPVSCEACAARARELG